MTEERKLTDADAAKVASELKTQIMQDFKLEVATGLLALVKKGFVLLLLLLAIYGITSDKSLLQAVTTGGR